MRHSFATYHLALFQSADQTALQLGHSRSTEMLFQNYRNLATESQGHAYFALTPPDFE